ncbi:MAG: hypothetical protein GY757_19135 [bacterium]|nr:hypothetical protein [bacterium]
MPKQYKVTQLKVTDRQLRIVTRFPIEGRLLCQIKNVPGVETVSESRYTIILSYGELFETEEVMAPVETVIKEYIKEARA